MATGSGKTLVMASSILYLYKKGYRNFLFFVNSDTIINKTKENFLNKSSSKYQFNKNSITIDGRKVEISEVSNFSQADDQNINILFTTIHGLHSKITNPSENSILINGLKNTKVVLLSDEAHHINKMTRDGNTDDERSFLHAVEIPFQTHPREFQRILQQQNVQAREQIPTRQAR
jgi:type III restriction enzyme